MLVSILHIDSLPLDPAVKQWLISTRIVGLEVTGQRLFSIYNIKQPFVGQVDGAYNTESSPTLPSPSVTGLLW